MHRITICLLFVACTVSSIAHGARFLPLGHLDEGDGFSSGQGISADGATIVGESDNKPFRWTELEGMVYLGDFPWGVAAPNYIGISGDGNVIFGDAGGKKFQWTQAAGYQEIFPGLDLVPSSISFDGSVYSFNPDVDISADGIVTVGSEVHMFGLEAYRDSPNDCGVLVRQWLGDLPGGAYQSSANAVSTNGRVVVGSGSTLYDDGMGTIYEVARPIHWSEGHSTLALGPWTSGYAREVSSTGLVIIGNGAASIEGGWESYRWTPATGMVSIRELLLAEGIDLDAMGWILDGVRSLSANGQVIVGTGINPSGLPEAFLIELPIPGDFDEDGDSDGNDFLAWQRGESLDPFNASDLADWEANWDFFSTVAGVSTSANAVPEPSSTLLLLAALTYGLQRRRLAQAPPHP